MDAPEALRSGSIGFGERPPAGDPRIVHHDVQPAPSPNGGLAKGSTLIGIAHVAQMKLTTHRGGFGAAIAAPILESPPSQSQPCHEGRTFQLLSASDLRSGSFVRRSGLTGMIVRHDDPSRHQRAHRDNCHDNAALLAVLCRAPPGRRSDLHAKPPHFGSFGHMTSRSVITLA
jgi:hypothetical protein